MARAEARRVHGGGVQTRGLTDVTIDPLGNVLGWRKGRLPNTFVVAAHLDTVFPAGTDVTVKHDGARLLGPGIDDDSRGLVCLVGSSRR